MSDTIDRLVPFTPETFKAVKESSEKAKRSFKQQAAFLVELALDYEKTKEGAKNPETHI